MIGIYSSQSAFSHTGTARSATQTDDSTQQKQEAVKKAINDDVTVSDFGKALSTSGIKPTSGLESHSLPSWMGQYISPLHDLGISQQAMQETREYSKMADKFTSDGHLSPSEKKGLLSYLKNAESTHEFMRRAEERAALQQELSEYGQYTDRAYAASMSAVGATSMAEYYEKINNDPSMEKTAHSAFRESLLGNTRVPTLMEMLGVKP